MENSPERDNIEFGHDIIKKSMLQAAKEALIYF